MNKKYRENRRSRTSKKFLKENNQDLPLCPDLKFSIKVKNL